MTTHRQERLKKISDWLMVFAICFTAVLIAIVDTWAYLLLMETSRTLAITFLIVSITSAVTLMTYLYGPARAKMFAEIEEKFPE